jgi:hypothetical protein
MSDDAKPARPVPRIGTGMPATIQLDGFGQFVADAFGHIPYHVGSSTRGKKWGDVDVRLILLDEHFDALSRGYERAKELDALVAAHQRDHRARQADDGRADRLPDTAPHRRQREVRRPCPSTAVSRTALAPAPERQPFGELLLAAHRPKLRAYTELPEDSHNGSARR